MKYVGIDIHKRYSVLAAQDEEGRKLKEARVEATGRVQSVNLGGERELEAEILKNGNAGKLKG